MKKMISLLLAAAMILMLAACGAAEPEKKSVDMTALYESIQDTLPEMMVLDENTMLNFFGIQAEDCAQVVTAVCANGLDADEVWLIEAKDEAALERLTTLVNTRLTAKEEENITYNPEQYAVIQKAVILTKDLYIAFLVSPDVDALKSTVESALN